jgi:hypothetical protein
LYSAIVDFFSPEQQRILHNALINSEKTFSVFLLPQFDDVRSLIAHGALSPTTLKQSSCFLLPTLLSSTDLLVQNFDEFTTVNHFIVKRCFPFAEGYVYSFQ